MSGQQRVMLYLDGFAIPRNYTFTRTGSVGKYTGEDSILVDEAADTIRRDWLWSDATAWYPDTPVLLMEAPGFTNLVTSDDLTTWTTVNMEGGEVTGGVSDPSGGTGAYTVVDDDGTNKEYIYSNVAFTGGGSLTRAFMAVVRRRSEATFGFQIGILANTTILRASLVYTWNADGSPNFESGSSSSGSHIGQRYVGNGYWAIYGKTNALVDSTDTNAAIIQPAWSNTDQGSVDVYRFNVVDSEWGPWSILDASETKNAEALYFDFPHAPQAMCGYVKFVELEEPNFRSTQSRVLQIGASANTNPRVIIYKNSGTSQYYLLHHNGVKQAASAIDISPAWGDTVELFWWAYADGSVLLAGRLNGGSISTGSITGTISFANAWSDTRLHLSSVGTTAQGVNAYHSVKVVAGSALTTTELASLKPGLVVGGLSIPVQQDSLKSDRLEIGDRSRSFSGKLHETIRNRLHVWTGKTTPLTVDSRNKILEQLESSTQPQTVFGGLLRTSTGGLADVVTRVTNESIIQSGTDRRYILEFTAEQSS